MARRTIELGFLNSLPVGEWFKPAGTLGRHKVCRLATDVFVNDGDVVYEIPSSFKGDKIEYNCGNISDPASSLKERFESWKGHQMRSLEDQLDVLQERYVDGHEHASMFSSRSVRAYENSQETQRMFTEMERLYTELERLKKMNAPKKKVVEFMITPMSKLEIWNKYGVSLF